MITEQTLSDILLRHWGYDSFRPLQKEIMLSAVSGRDTLALMPTGGGKSISFQVPGLALGGMTIVVTPLVSLMKDQVDNLRRRNIRAVYLRAGMTSAQRRLAWEKITNGRCSFLYVAPERIGNDRFCNELRQLDIRLIVVDEAHCISQWGYDFRPPYLQIARLRKIKPGVPVLAVTATATPEVAKDICEKLEFRNGTVLSKSFARDNISYLVRHTDDKIGEIIHILSRTSGSAIVYVRNRKRTKQLCDALLLAGIDATWYHAGLSHEVKEEHQNQWKEGKKRVIVATNAFGMGIDKPDVRVVIHFAMPSSLEEYYQEAGRAGRDGKPSYAVLLNGRHDAAKARARITESFPPKEVIRKIYDRVCNFLNISLEEGYMMIRQFDVEKFCATFGYKPVIVSSALKILENSGYLVYEEDADIFTRIFITPSREDLYSIDLPEKTENVLRTIMRNYGGLFTDYVQVNENLVAMEMNIDTRDVYDALLEMQRRKILRYIPRQRTPVVMLTTARVEPHEVLIAKAAYEKRRDAMRQRIETMIRYTQITDECRVAYMLSYFGEKGEDCGNCDVCRERRKAKDTDITPSIHAALVKAGAPVDFRTLAEHYDPQRLQQALNLLCEQRLVCRQGMNYSAAKPGKEEKR